MLAGDLALFRASKYKSGASHRALFLDLDGTLWPDTGVGSIVNVNTLKIPKRVTLERLAKDWIIIGVSNQTLFCYREKFNLAIYLIYRLKLFLLLSTGIFNAIYICHHHPKSRLVALSKFCDNRKPNPGFLFRSQRDFNLDLSQSVFVGDRVTDMVAAESAGVSKRYLISGEKAFERNTNDTKFKKSYSFCTDSSFDNILKKILIDEK